jgi:hypothetical protein
VFVENFYRLLTLSSHLGPFKWYQSRGHRLIEGLTTSVSKDGSSCVQPYGGKQPFFDGTCYDYWKRNMKMYLDTINGQVWDVTESDYVILNLGNLTNTDKANKQCNTMTLNTIYNAIDSKVFEQIKDYEKVSKVWKRLEETYEGTSMVKSAKQYILKEKLTSFKMKDDESISKMFHRLQVIVNNLKTLEEKINDDNVSHRFLMCLPPRFEILRLIIITPNQVLGDVITQETYRVER